MTAPRVPNIFSRQDPANPKLPNLFSPSTLEEEEDETVVPDDPVFDVEEENPFFLAKAWDLTKYVGSLMFTNSLSKSPLGNAKNTQEYRDAVTGRASKTGGDIYNYLRSTSIKDMLSDAGQTVISPFKSTAEAIGEAGISGLPAFANSLANGMIDLFVETPLEALTGLRNVNGKAVAMSPEQHVKSVQDTYATAINVILQRGITNKMLKAPAASLKPPSKAGRLAQVAKANLVGGTASGTADALVRNVGEENFAESVANDILTSAVLGTALGTMFDFPAYNKKVMAGELEARAARRDLIQTKASLASLANRDNVSIVDALSNVQAFAASDNALEAALRSGAHKEGFIVPDIEEVALKELIEKIQPSVTQPLPYTPTQKLRRPGNIHSAKVEFESAFDQAAYLVRKPGKNDDILVDVMRQTGLTATEIRAHGQYILSQAKEMYDRGLLYKYTQDEVNMINAKAIERGRNISFNTAEGQTVVDYMGGKWTRQGPNFVSPEGQVRPAEDQTLHQLFGSRKGTDPNKGVVRIGAQEFHGNYGREATPITYIKGPNNTFLVTGGEVPPETKTLFERTGFAHQEKVRYNNQEVFVVGMSKTSPGKIEIGVPTKSGYTSKVVSAKHLVRLPSDGLKHANVTRAGSFNMGVFGQESTFNQFVDNVIKEFDEKIWTPISKKEPTTKVFDDILISEARKMNVGPEDIDKLRPIVHKRLQNKLVSTVLDPGEAAVFNDVKAKLEEYSLNQMENEAAYFNNLVDQNGYYIVDTGNAGFEIRDIETNNLVTHVDDVSAGIDFIHKSGQLPLSNPVPASPIPPETAQLGNLVSKFEPKDNFRRRLVERINTSSMFGAGLVPARNAFAAFDNLAHRLGIKESILSPVERIQDALNKKNIFWTQSKESLDHYQRAIDLAKSIPGYSGHNSSRISQYIQTMTREQIENGVLIGRPLTQIEKQFAAKLANDLSNVNETTTALANAYEQATKQGHSVGSPEFNEILTRLTTEGAIKPQLSSSLIEIGQLIKQYDKNIFTPHAVVKLADSIMHPSAYVDRPTLAKKLQLDPKEIQIAENLEKFFSLMGERAGIPKDTWIGGYLPHMKLQKQFGRYNSFTFAEEFSRELSRVMDSSESYIQDPFALAHAYGMTAANHASGTIAAINQAEKTLEKVIAQIDAAGKPAQAQAARKTFAEYLLRVRGDADVSVALRGAVKEIEETLGGTKVEQGVAKTVRPLTRLDPSSLAAHIELALTGLRPIQGVRDFSSTFGNTFILFGKDFAKRVYHQGFSNFSEADATKLQLGGKIPSTTALEMLRPGDSIEEAILASPGFQKMAEVGLKYSLQMPVFVRFMAGIHKATKELALEELGKAQRGLITKEAAYKKIQLDVHPPAVQREFDRFVSSGDLEAATDFLSKWNQKALANDYRKGNLPVSWRRGFGRLAGQMGSWGTNELQTMMNGFASEQALRRTLRSTVFNGIVKGVAVTSGLNLSSWMLTPMSVAPGIGPGIELMNDIATGINQSGSLDEGVENLGQDALGKALIPFYDGPTDIGKIWLYGSFALRDIFKGIEVWNEEEDPVKTALKMFGLKEMQQQ